jgi:hypothetical protein
VKSVHKKVLFCLVKNAINKTGPIGPSFVGSGLLSSRVVRCHATGQNKPRTGQHGWLLNVHGELTLICQSLLAQNIGD